MYMSPITVANPMLVYIPDALCSHSYGFEPQIRKIKNHFATRLGFELINGGLRPYGKKRIIENAAFLREHWKEIELNTNQPFNYDLLSSETFIVDSEPPARAVVVCREMCPEKEFEFFLAVERLVFLENKDSNKLESYFELIGKSGLDRKTFIELFNSPWIRQKTRADFEKAAALGVTGFPSVLIKIDGKYELISKGYTDAGIVITRIENNHFLDQEVNIQKI